MKKIILVLISAAMLFQIQAGNVRTPEGESQKSSSVKGSLTIAATPELLNLATGWANEYSALNPDQKIRVVSIEDRDAANNAGSGTSLSLVYDDFGKSADTNPGWKMVIGRDVTVPVINSANPMMKDIISQGISAEKFARYFSSPENRTWGTLLGGGQQVPATLYLSGNESILAGIAGFTGLGSESITGIKVDDGAAMIEAIRKDPNAFGFCKLSQITDQTGQNLAGMITLLPIDKNANGKMDYIEKIYDNVADLSRGIWIGKYPKALCGSLNVFAPIKPDDENEIAFLKYLLTTGQQSIELAGYSSLTSPERLSKIDRLPGSITRIVPPTGINLTQLIITLIAGLIFIMAVAAFIVRFRKANRPSTGGSPLRRHAGINEHSLIAPGGILFGKTHTWAFMEKDGTVKVGIDDFLQHVTGPITKIKMKLVGEKVKMGEPVMTIIQKGKRLVISAPLSGVIKSENTVLYTDPSIVNSSPYTDGWIYQIEPTNWLRETQFLLMAEKYSEWIKNEFTRLKDFIANAVKPNDPEYACVILQDGGEVSDHVLENLGPEVWEEFQTNFINASKF